VVVLGWGSVYQLALSHQAGFGVQSVQFAVVMQMAHSNVKQVQGVDLGMFRWTVGTICVRYSELAPFDGLIWPHL
jgi:hypothetical protein